MAPFFFDTIIGQTIQKHLKKAIELRVDGIVVGGFDSDDFSQELKKARVLRIKIWRPTALE